MARDLLAAVGWAVFVGGGVALGLWLGSLGADVPADSGMLVITGLIAGSATLTVRIAMATWKHRPGARAAGGGATDGAPEAPQATGRPSRSAPPARTRRRAPAPSPEDEGKDEGEDARAPARTRKRPTGRKPAERKSAERRKPAARKPPARRKRPEGGTGSSRRGR